VAELDAGLRSAIGPDSELRHVGTHEGVASVNLSPEFIGVGGEEQILAVAQIVFTATEATGVARVQFFLDGEPVAVPTESGTLVDTPVGRDGFNELAPP
jgi:spore germination protein GerM